MPAGSDCTRRTGARASLERLRVLRMMSVVVGRLERERGRGTRLCSVNTSFFFVPRCRREERSRQVTAAEGGAPSTELAWWKEGGEETTATKRRMKRGKWVDARPLCGRTPSTPPFHDTALRPAHTPSHQWGKAAALTISN
jgi:hypothetical protein